MPWLRGICLTILAILAFENVGLAQSEEYSLTTLAGPDESGPGAIDAAGVRARFYGPQGVAADGAGNLYVADTVNNTIRKISSAGLVGTLAGRAGETGSADGMGSGARFDGPVGIAVDKEGRVVVADTGNSTIRAITPEGFVTTIAGLARTVGRSDGLGKAARFNRPQGVTVDDSGNVYVADTSNYTIRKISPAGLVTTFAGTADGVPLQGDDGTGNLARFYYPEGITIDHQGNLFVSDTYNGTIRKITQERIVTTVAGEAGSFLGRVDGAGRQAGFLYPAGLAVDDQGNVYVADGAIRKVTPEGIVTTLRFDGLAGAFGLAVGIGGTIWVADPNRHAIFELSGEETVRTSAGSERSEGSSDGASSEARFSGPNGVAVDGEGNVIVSDSNNFTVRKIDLAGRVTTIAGQAGSLGTNDGVGAVARFFTPTGVAVDKANNIFVADTDNNTVRKITSAGVVSTIAGLAGVTGASDGVGADARFYGPVGVALDKNGNLYVADSQNSTIRKLTFDSAVWTVATLAGQAGHFGDSDGVGTNALFGKRFQGPTSLSVDESGNIYVSDSANKAIRKVSPAGAVTTVLIGLDSPSGTAPGPSGDLYFADAVENAIFLLKGSGEIALVAGLAGSGGSADGMGRIGRLRGPQGLAIAPSGNLYIADSVNNSIRIANPSVCSDQPTIDRSSGPVLQERELGTNPQTAVAWQWRIVRRPADSVATLSSVTGRNPRFTPDKPDLYGFELRATNASGGICIRNLDFMATASVALESPRVISERFEMILAAPTNHSYTIEASAELNRSSWIPLLRTNAAIGRTLIIDFTPADTHRFYRAVVSP